MLSAPLLFDHHHQQQQQKLYERLHPPGWCLVPGLEQRHRDIWVGLSRRLLEADKEATTLLQMLVTIQVLDLTQTSLLTILNCRQGVSRRQSRVTLTDKRLTIKLYTIFVKHNLQIERLQHRWNTEALSYCRKTFGEEGLFRSNFKCNECSQLVY